MTMHRAISVPEAKAIYRAAFGPMGALPDTAMRLSDLQQDSDSCAIAIAEELRHEPGLDAKGCGAYLVNRLAHEIGKVLAALDLSGHDLRALDPATTGFVTTLAKLVENGETYLYLETDVTIAPVPAGPAADAAQAGLIYQALFDPVVTGVSMACKLGPAALWRLVTDGIAAGYLTLGTQAGEAPRAIARAEAILKRPGTRLFAKQLNFLDVTLPAADNPLGTDLTETFRERAGCCRYYTTPRSDGEYCATCIHRKDRADRLRRAMLHRARLAAGLPGL
ncbi:MAG: (2Fe-2S)-binding protein [Loktanella sp.]|nr:(2Fe-2S)-binding protein [Loktanella sp.]